VCAETKEDARAAGAHGERNPEGDKPQLRRLGEQAMLGAGSGRADTVVAPEQVGFTFLERPYFIGEWLQAWAERAARRQPQDFDGSKASKKVIGMAEHAQARDPILPACLQWPDKEIMDRESRTLTQRHLSPVERPLPWLSTRGGPNHLICERSGVHTPGGFQNGDHGVRCAESNLGQAANPAPGMQKP